MTRRAALALALGALAPRLGAQGLGEAARRERLRREERKGRGEAPAFGDADLEAPGAGWRPFRAPDGSFLVLFPHRPSVEDDSSATPFGAAKRRSYRAAKDGLDYAVIVIDYPPTHVTQTGSEPLIDEAQAALVAAEGGAPQGQRPAALGPHAGREFTYSRPGERYAVVNVLVRAYLVGSRLYLVCAASSTEAETEDRPDGFLGSFRLLSAL